MQKNTSPHGIVSDAFDPVRMGLNGAVVTNHPIASSIGISILEQGGTAMDAATAISFALGVVEPNGSGIGGDGYVMVFDKKTGKLDVFNGTGASPLHANSNTEIHKFGILSASVPGIVGAVLQAHERHGKLPLHTCLAASIALAEEGVPVSHFQATMTAKYDYLHQDPEAAAVYAPQGKPLEAGEIRRNIHLANSYKLIAREGEEAFYRGPIAKAIADYSAQHGGLLVLEDFLRHTTTIDQPISTNYRGYHVYTAAPNSSGHVLLQQLNILEQTPFHHYPYLSAEAIHWMVEAKRLAFMDREAYLGDPNNIDIPLTGLLSKTYAAERAALIHADHAIDNVTPGNAWRHNPTKNKQHAPDTLSVTERLDDTTHFCVIDKYGNAVSQLQSLNMMYGSQIMVPGTGILLNNRMSYWHKNTNHPNVLAPNKKVRHTMNPVMVFHGEASAQNTVRWVLGTPGGDTQVQTNFQIISALIDHGLTESEAVQTPRWCHHQDGTYSNHPHNVEESLTLEQRDASHQTTIDTLSDKGHQAVAINGWAARGSAGIAGTIPNSKTLVAAADLRRDGQAQVF
jgi:gamma-glutamyltranspeptidase